MTRSAIFPITVLAAIAASSAALAGDWYIQGAGAGELQHAQGYKALVAEVARVCKPGDTVSIPGDMVGAIGSICDFSKSIVTTSNGSTVCVVRAGIKGSA